MRLKLAIQKKGRLQEDSISLFKECGLDFEIGTKEQLKIEVKNLNLDIYLLRNSDIPKYVYSGVVDAGMIGENTVIESELQLQQIKKVNFGKCKLSLAIPKEITYNDLTFFNNKTIATSYPNTLKNFLKENNIKSNIHEINGSVELSTQMGLADGICDLVSTGGTLLSNGLKQVYDILYSQVALYKCKELKKEKNIIIEQLCFRIDSVLNAKKNKYIMMNVPNENLEQILKILPGIKSPTVLPLSESNWCSVHTVIQKDNFWNIINQLKNSGAQGILVVPIEQMIL